MKRKNDQFRSNNQKNLDYIKNYLMKNIKNNTLNGILLVNFPEKEKMFLVKTLAAENKIPLITQSASLLFTDSLKLNDFSTVKDPIQIFFDKVQEVTPCICFLNNIESIGEKRNVQEEKDRKIKLSVSYVRLSDKILYPQHGMARSNKNSTSFSNTPVFSVL